VPNRKKPATPRIEKPIHVVMPLDGDSSHPADDDCPICRMLHEQGETAYTMSPDGRLVEIEHSEPTPTIAVTVVASFLTEAVLGEAPMTLEVPVGCVTGDFLAYLWYSEPGLQAFPEGALRLQVNGHPVSPLQVLCGHDVVTVVATRPPRVNLLS